MSSLVYDDSKFKLTDAKLEEVLRVLREKLQGRVTAAYLFGSASTGSITADSDVDLILVRNDVQGAFVHRALEFSDLHDVFPKLDILVYTDDELARQLADSAVGFWKSVRESMKRIL